MPSPWRVFPPRRGDRRGCEDVRKNTAFLLLSGILLLVLFIAGCSTVSFEGKLPSSFSAQTGGKFIEYSSERILLDVPFLPQVPPGNWSSTRNCGVASAVMIAAYYLGTTPSPEDIKEADDWLNARFGLPINGYNGDYTNVFQIRAYLESRGVPTRIGMGNLEVLRGLLRAGKPVLVAVFADMNLQSSKHAMVAVGMDSFSIYVHDPGKPNGAYNSYPIGQFLSAWEKQGNWYVTIE
uniref:Peptidase C39-like domain-containing protein n=1 Tax=Candidatus Caldatribacterium californiense TaxID=1454726 RepID=A0A7V3YI92_9BACT